MQVGKQPRLPCRKQSRLQSRPVPCLPTSSTRCFRCPAQPHFHLAIRTLPQVRIGGYGDKHENATAHVRRQTAQTFAHRKYQPPGLTPQPGLDMFDYDVALLRLDQPVLKYADGRPIRPIRLTAAKSAHPRCPALLNAIAAAAQSRLRGLRPLNSTA